jgi:hypothetical protein
VGARRLERPVRFVVPPLGLLDCGCLEGGVANTHGDHALALRGVIFVAPSRRFARLKLLPIHSYFSKSTDAISNGFGVVLMADLPPRAQRCWRAVHDFPRSITASKESSTRRTRAPSEKASAMQSFAVGFNSVWFIWAIARTAQPAL